MHVMCGAPSVDNLQPPIDLHNTREHSCAQFKLPKSYKLQQVSEIWH